jgi:hypothetical protein
MGLDTTHDAFHGAYSAFQRFRQMVARAMGGSYPPHDNPNLTPGMWYWWAGADEDDPGTYRQETHPGLYAFFMSDDCGGVSFDPETCRRIADELEALLPEIERLDDGGSGHIADQGGYAAVTRQYVAGCRRAADAGEPLEYG